MHKLSALMATPSHRSAEQNTKITDILEAKQVLGVF
jgi:hypothetical protein